MPDFTSLDAIVIGGGAAGLMCAIEAGKRGKSVAVVERAERLGKKILISGGGRCNFTNLYCEPENFLSSNPHFAKSALSSFTPRDFIALVEKHKILFHEKRLGQLFCDGSSHEILAMLESECVQAGVKFFLNVQVREVSRDTVFAVRFADIELRAPALVVASGGLSIPRMGATGFGYDLARQFGLKIRETRPALVPLCFGPAESGKFDELAGVSTKVIAECRPQPRSRKDSEIWGTPGHRFREKMLFTHRGLSGPAILQASSYWRMADKILIDLAPGEQITAKLRAQPSGRSMAAARSAFQEFLPQRLAHRWLELYAPSSWTNAALDDLEHRAHAWEISPSGTEGYEKAEVTAGGVDTDELSAKTMESRKIPGLFFIGEVVDVTGQLGGFNFQWAWASGAAAGRAL